VRGAATVPARPNTHQKALQINLDRAKYGTFAEIGAGQEVARWFFHVGGAAGTVAKTISAYDMTVSDAIYGPTARYVCRQRLEAMLDHEYTLLLQRLESSRGSESTFFVFADTVATRSHQRQQDGEGWLGMRFQTQPRAAPSEIILHVGMRDSEPTQQQEALGILGVNLIAGAFELHRDPLALLLSLTDDLARNRVEVDMIQFTGPAFAGVDNRLMSLRLVEHGLTDAALFNAGGEVVQPSEVLYKRPILVERGRFRPITNLTLDLLDRALEQFRDDPRLQGATPVVLTEMTLRDLTAEGGIDHHDFLARVDTLAALSKTVLISNYMRYFRLVEYLSRYSQQPTCIAVGVPSLLNIADQRHYEDLTGGVLESVGRLFKEHVRLYVYPYREPDTGRLVTAETIAVAPHWRHLHAHLLEHRLLEPIRRYTSTYLPIRADEVLAQIRAGDARWEGQVPAAVVQVIKAKQLFGWRPPAA